MGPYHADTCGKSSSGRPHRRHRAVSEAQRRSWLRGDVDSRMLAQQIYRNYQKAASEWAQGEIDLATFRARGLLCVYTNFAADATEAFRPTVLARILALDPDEVRKRKLDSYEANKTTSGTAIPLRHRETKSVAKRLDIQLTVDREHEHRARLAIRFGKHLLEADVTMHPE